MASGFITSRSRGPQLDVKNKSSVYDFLFGPEPVCRLTLNRVFSHVLHQRGPCPLFPPIAQEIKALLTRLSFTPRSILARGARLHGQADEAIYLP